MIVRASHVAFWVLGGGALALAQFEPAPLNDPELSDIALTVWTNSTTWSRVEWTEWDPATENVTTPTPYNQLLETPFPIDQVRSCSFANLDGDDQTDWVLLVHHGPGRLSTVEHWEGGEFGMGFQQVLFEAAPFPAQMIALTFGDLDGDEFPDILTIEDPTGVGPQVVRHYEQAGTGWGVVAEFPIGAPTDRFVALTVGSLDADEFTDVLLIRDDEQGGTSAIDHYHFSAGQLLLVGNLVTEPRDTHRFQALDLGTLKEGRMDVLVLDWFFLQLVHELQRWEFTDNALHLTQIVREAIPPDERLIDVSIATPAKPIEVWDFCFSFDPVDWGPGLWTKDGVPIGTTFPDGVTTGGPDPVIYSDHGYVFCEPNDWHWDVHFDWLGFHVWIWFWFENFGPDDHLWVEIYCTEEFPEIFVDVDIGDDTYTLREGEGMDPFHTAPWSGYPDNLPDGFQATGSCRSNDDDPVLTEPVDPPVSGDTQYQRTLVMDLPQASAGTETAYRVTLVTLYNPSDPQPFPPQDFSLSEGEVRYLNLLRDFDDNVVTECVSSAAFGTTYPCITVGCDPEFADWGTLFGDVTAFVSGNAIIPDSTYTVAQLASSCVGNAATCSDASAEVTFATARYGDVQPDGLVSVGDVVLTVDAVKQLAGSAFEYQVFVRKVNPAPQNDSTNVSDIVAHVDALKLFAYQLPVIGCP